MEGMNKVLLLGNLGADPELRVTAGGTAVLKLRMATTERHKDNNDQWVEKTEWHQVVVWGKRGEALAKILGKGDRIFVEGGNRTSSWEKDGVKHYKTEVHATNVILSGRERSSRESPSAPPEGTRGATSPPGRVTQRTRVRAAPPPPREPQQVFGQEEDDIPF